jgi:microcystin-dependent protein
MVGLNGSDTLFDALEETGGSKDAIVVSHTHTGTTAGAGAHTHTMNASSEVSNSMSDRVGDNGFFAAGTKSFGMSDPGNHTHTFTTDSTGSSGTNANLQPYITVAMWKRTA